MNNHTFMLNNSVRNLILCDKALEIAFEFKKKNIDFLVLKGLYFAFFIYPSADLRSMQDIDFLVKRGDLDKIDEILKYLGYFETTSKAQRTYGCDCTFSYQDGTFSVDIHWDLCQYERFKRIINITDDFWRRAGEFKFNGITLRTFSNEDYILYISLHHSLVHSFREKRGIYDIFFLITGRGIDYRKVIDNVSKYGIKIPLYYSLLNVSAVTNLKFPDFVLRSLKPSFLKQTLLASMFKYNTTALRYLCQALMLDNFFDTLKVLGRLLRGMPRAHRRTRANTVLNFHPDAPSSGHI